MSTAGKAGGGQRGEAEQRLRITSPNVTKRLEALHHEILSQHHDLYTWLSEVQPCPAAIAEQYKEQARCQTPFETFLDFLTSPFGDIVRPGRPFEEDDLTYPLSNYFISSSHNTYLTGNQLSSDSSADGYRDVLLRGCRCVEIDVWNGREEEEISKAGTARVTDNKDDRSLRSRLLDRLRSHRRSKADFGGSPIQARPSNEGVKAFSRSEPRVLHGYTLTKEISFREVCQAIHQTAFKNSDLPVIVSLEVHANLQQQAIMVDIIVEEWKEFLVHLPSASQPDIEALPPPGALRKKLLIKVKYTAPEKAKKQHEAAETSKKPVSSDTMSDDSASSEDEDDLDVEAKPRKKKKMLDSLSTLGIYTRSHHFKSFDQPEARLPTHVFSLSESGVSDSHEANPEALFQHNKRFFMRAYPKGTRISSSNLNPALFWRQGIQIVALNWQKCDKGMMLNEAMFAGTGGWVLKPEAYRSKNSQTAHTSPQAPSTLMPPAHPETSSSPENWHGKVLDLKIEFLAAQSIPLPDEESERSFKPYIKCTLHTETLTSTKSPSTRVRGSLERRRSSRSDRKADNARNANRGSRVRQTTVDGSSKSLFKGRSETRHGRSPDLAGEVMTFKNVRIDEGELSFLRFKIEDDISLRADKLAAWACCRLDKVANGLRIVRLFNKHGRLSDGFLLVNVTSVIHPNHAAKQQHAPAALPMR